MKVIKRYTVLFVLYLICIIGAYDDQTDFFYFLAKDSRYKKTILINCYFLMNLSGLLIAIARFTEPYVLEDFKRRIFKK